MPGRLGQVRCFFGEAARRACQMVHAEAFTVGNIIVFGVDTPSAELVAHELTHVVQQGGHHAPLSAVPSTLPMTQPGDDHEHQAEQHASSPSPPAAERSAPMLARFKVIGGAGVGLRADAGDLLGSANLLPGGTRVVEGARRTVRGEAWVEVRVSTGPRMGERGWLLESELVNGVDRTSGASLMLVNEPGDLLGLCRLPPDSGLSILAERAVNGKAWAKVRVTSGAQVGAEGWVEKAEIVEHTETQRVDSAQAQQLFTELAHANFVTKGGGEAPIPFHYPPDGCYIRAHLMSELLTEKGYANDKVFAFAKTAAGGANLRVPTPFAGDTAAPGGQPAVQWWYHVAPIIRVLAPDRKTEQRMVLDPSMFDHPVTISEWTGRMNGQVFTEVTPAALQAEVNLTGYPKDRPLVTVTHRSVVHPGMDLTGTDMNVARNYYNAEGRNVMSDLADSARVHELAAALRGQLASPPLVTASVLATIRGAPRAVRQGLRASFPNLITDLTTPLGAADKLQVQAAIDAP